MTYVIAVTGSLGKTTTCQMINYVMRKHNLNVVLSTTQGIYENDNRIALGDNTTGLAARVLLYSQPDYGIFEFGRGGLYQTGMVIPNCNIGILVNVKNTHQGMLGINTIEQMLNVKKMIPKSAIDLSIIDDSCLDIYSELSPTRTCIISTNKDNIKFHLDNGNKAIVYENNVIQVYNHKQINTFDPKQIPASINGTLFPIINAAMITIAACSQLGIPMDLIFKYLSTFVSDPNTNIGRHNIFGDQIKVFGTWADGSDALQMLNSFVNKQQIVGKKRIVIAAMDQRTDQYIIDMGKEISGLYDWYYCCEPHIKRGRDVGQVSNLLSQGINLSNTSCHLSIHEGITKSINDSNPGDFVLIVAVLKSPEIDLIQQLVY